MYTTLIECEELAAHLGAGDWVVVDCRFDLADTEAGRQAYLLGHVPGAVYAHLEADLSGFPLTDSGRHPLPSPAALNALFGRLGISAGTQVVVYDSANGAIASRLWWLLRYMGHEAAAVLDGGWGAWQAADLPEERGEVLAATAVYHGKPHTEWLVQAAAVPQQVLLVDSRSPARYRGEIEPFDPVAGHIPGAVNFFYQWNWDANGRYLPKQQLQAQLTQLLGDIPAEEATFYCGSGVTACVNLLVLAHAGMGNSRLYAGSWSDWITDEKRPFAN